MSTITEGQHAAEFIVSEANGFRSRDEVTLTVAAETTLVPGLVLGKLTATGKYVPYDNAGGDGSDVAAGILYAGIENPGEAPADYQVTVVNRDAEVRLADLQWASGLVDADKTAAYADLLALGIKVRS
jgi:hypothetical protein